MSSTRQIAPVRKSITAAQCRGARGMLGWSQKELAERAGISARALFNFENGNTTPYPKTMTDLLACFEAAGVEFIETDGRIGATIRVEPAGG